VGWYVTRRLARIAHAADEWRRGDFSRLIDDRSRDELGYLAGQLDAMAGDLKALLATRSQLATLNERQRLARNLHDTVKQKAFALNLQLATAAKTIDAHSSAGAGLAVARRLSGQIQHELAAILDELRGADDPVLPLAELLAPRIADWSRASGIPATVRLAATCALPPAQADDVVRLLDEALANIQRHSGARHVEVELATEGARWRLRIRDDGCGGAAPRPGGMGIGNMRTRAAQLPGGRLDLPEGSAGTEIQLSWDP
jgi:signal transduction histidine kinase